MYQRVSECGSVHIGLCYSDFQKLYNLLASSLAGLSNRIYLMTSALVFQTVGNHTAQVRFMIGYGISVLLWFIIVGYRRGTSFLGGHNSDHDIFHETFFELTPRKIFWN